MKYVTIGEAAARWNIPESTIRYYEKKGLLPFIERDEAGRRLFSERQMALFEIILCLKNTQMPIGDIKQYMDWVAQGDDTVDLRLEMMKKHKQAVQAHIDSMTESLAGIDVKIDRYTNQINQREEERK
ncbi:MerR family transcriptional regulator [Cohnella thailandensis]|uniref:MerR family transcriptional regulator n=1 Tax=Cohnella thailandensis TaxID=557557 RepID=A0A841SQ90_9BACL|nr:MerR family transcriptional regulator [Cohnella thailandensis]MBB6634124.1 MerR family transcriptional regulator [Cohnella thailandensis]MBP1972383.1 DNA-binding transcriptional MerR regulator [Cohnella thailandensis]